MKKSLALLLAFFASSCAMALAPSGPGILYTKTSEVIYYDPYIKPVQKATLCSKNILGLISIGDSSFEALKLNSDIRKIYTMERTYDSRYLIYAQSCLVVKGE